MLSLSGRFQQFQKSSMGHSKHSATGKAQAMIISVLENHTGISGYVFKGLKFYQKELKKGTYRKMIELRNKIIKLYGKMI